MNGSTPAVLLASAILRAAGSALLHIRKFTSPAGFPAMIAAARAAVRRGVLIPLSTFDPAPAGHPARPPSLLALVRGTSEQDVRAVEIRPGHRRADLRVASAPCPVQPAFAGRSMFHSSGV